jgi:hypothetical protein
MTKEQQARKTEGARLFAVKRRADTDERATKNKGIRNTKGVLKINTPFDWKNCAKQAREERLRLRTLAYYFTIYYLTTIFN